MHTRVARTPRRIYFVVAIALLMLCAAGWATLLPASDSRGPRYLLWKWGVAPFDEAVVYAAMVQDLDRDALVLGLTENELRARFPDLRSPQSILTPEQLYYTDAELQGKNVLWLGHSAWLVRLEQGRVVSLQFAKG